jgi:lysophospholipase L1-like esterase
MRVHSSSVRVLVCVVLLGVAVAGLAVPALSAPRAIAPSSEAVTRGSDYLALGDSVTFGYREPTTTPPPNYYHASSFVAYPEDVGTALGLHVANAACPGETSLSLLEAGVQSNDCENLPGGGPGYRSAYPLHVKYSGTQLHFALSYLKSHHDTRLVTLMIGANDAFLCEETTPDHCASQSELAGVLAQVSSDVGRTLSAIRHRAHYRGQIVIENYYSLDYSSATAAAGTQALNSTVDAAATPYGATIADGYGVLEAAAAQSGGNSCTAGLLTQLTGGGCGVHPSLAGQALLALAVEQAIRR